MMAEQEDDNQAKRQEPVEPGRREFLKGGAAVAGAGLAAAGVAGTATPAAAAKGHPENPYGARPGGGISLPAGLLQALARHQEP